MVYIYALRCPVSGHIRYIGKTKDRDARLWQHLNDAKTGKTHRARWVKKLLLLGLSPSMETLLELSDDAVWQEAEIRCIAEHRAAGHPLTNMTSGGEGIDDLPPESVAQHRASLRRAWADPSARERRLAELRKFVIEANKRPEVRARNAAAQRAAWAAKDMDSRAAVSNKTSASMKALWGDPDVRAAKLARLQSPEVHAKRVASRAMPESKTRTREKLLAAWARRKAEMAT
jgi:predicted GIY-YIG superfamily endonuclease